MSTRTLERVETERLVCERLRAEHAAELRTLMLDPRVARTLWPRRQLPTEEALANSLAAKILHWKRHGFGDWLLRDRSPGRPALGLATLAPVGRGAFDWVGGRLTRPRRTPAGRRGCRTRAGAAWRVL